MTTTTQRRATRDARAGEFVTAHHDPQDHGETVPNDDPLPHTFANAPQY
jgi:hypothetical protein